MENEGWKRFRVLTLALILSGALNVGLILALAISTLKTTAIAIPEKKIASENTDFGNNGQILNEMFARSFSELLVYLTNRDPVEEGYMKRDLALSALTGVYFFDLEKALAGPPPQKRSYALASGKLVELYPGLTEPQYEAIIRYAYEEKWPLTSKGLFVALKTRLSQAVQEESLCQAFARTPEFLAVQVLFQKTGTEEEVGTLCSLLSLGPWELLERFFEEQSKLLDLSVERRRSFLMSYLPYHSKAAAFLLLKTDFAFAKTRLTDQGVLSILELLKEPTDLAKQFCIDLLQSPRSDAVWRSAASVLYQFAEEPMAEPFDHQIALQRFAPLKAMKPLAPTVKEKQPPRFREHVVQEGETLWKISRLYKVKVDELMRINDLEKEILVPGMVLRLSQGTGSNPPR